MIRGRTFNRETTYAAGEYLDGCIYPVFQPAGTRRKRCRPTSAVQKRLNQRNAELRLQRLLHANFTSSDLAVTLTYRTDVGDEREAARLLKNFIKRLQRLYRKAGVELKWIQSTERGSKGGRLHHHLVLSGGVDRDTIERAWGLGWANTKRLQFEENGLADLARYMTKDRASYRRWSCSRNLIRPEPVQHDGRLAMPEVEELAEAIEDHSARAWFEREYPGYELIGCRADRNGINRGVYIRFEMRRRSP